jgi:hypothetical protein
MYGCEDVPVDHRLGRTGGKPGLNPDVATSHAVVYVSILLSLSLFVLLLLPSLGVIATRKF